MERLRMKSGFNVKLCDEGHKGERGRKSESPCVHIAAAKNSLRNKQLPTAVQSITPVCSGGRKGGGRERGRSAAVGDPFINQTAGAEPRLAPLNRKPPGIFNGTLYSAVFPYYLGGGRKE